jgi:hypothetical protein
MAREILKGGFENDCLSRRYKRLVKWWPGVRKAAKSKFWKRMRKEAKLKAMALANDANAGKE